MQRKVTVALPSYFECDAANDFYNKNPFIQMLINKASKQTAPDFYHFFSNSLCHQLSVAAITGLADGLDTREDYWIRADPVDLQTDINSVYFMGNRHLDMNMTQVRCIAAEIRPIIEEYGYKLYTPKPYRWYLKLPHAVKISTPTPETMLGNSIREYLTEADSSWRKMFTEIQMVLNQCEVNLCLKQKISGLWFWGGGYFPELPQLPWCQIYGDGPLAEGIAKAKGLNYGNSQEKTFDNIKELNNDLLVFNEIYGIYTHVLKYLYKAMRQRRLKYLDLYVGDEFIYHIDAKTAHSWWQFWRKYS